MARRSLAICLLLLFTLSAVYEVQGTFLLRHYMRKFPRRSGGFRPFACSGMMRFVDLLQHRCPLTAPFRLFFGKLRSYVTFLSTASVSTNYDTELKGQTEGLYSAMTQLTGNTGSSGDSTKVIDTLMSMGKTLGENQRSGSLIMTFAQRRELALSMAKWAQVIGQFVVSVASKSGTNIDISTLGIDGIDAQFSGNTGSPNPASGSPTGFTPTPTGTAPTGFTPTPTGTAPTGTAPTGTVPTDGSMSGNANTNVNAGANANGGANFNGGVNANGGANFKGSLNYQGQAQAQGQGQVASDHQATTAGGH